ncbi:MAG: amidophosphoribosyltransferase [Polyangiaceae bacterium]|jgi:amidophosphoribosyltransferase|nr:amidophosphoribosyltransferase [Polyangiaceae bacterium]
MCGIFGIVGSAGAAEQAFVALQALQHRGQDACGIATISGGRFPFVRHVGLVNQAFTAENLKLLPGRIAVGHVRYPTIGSGVPEDAQPLFFRQPGIHLAHNGNLTNYGELVRHLQDQSIHMLTHCDAEPLLCELALALQRKPRGHTLQDAYDALSETWSRAQGSYSVVASMILDGKETLIVARDYLGIRPAVWGTTGDGCYVAASESTALDAVGAQMLGDVAAGEVIFLRERHEPVRRLLARRDGTPAGRAPCIFEQIYFARPDSRIEGRTVYSTRMELGRALACEWRRRQIPADVVIPIPDTARPAAMAVAEELGLPYREGFIKNRYSGRTFIMPSQVKREVELRLKLNPIRPEFQGRHVLLVDDSIVRGTTLAHTVDLVRRQGVASVHLTVYSPPVLFPCYYGIDMSTSKELLARRLAPNPSEGGLSATALETLQQSLARQLGLDSLTYLSVDALNRCWDAPRCAACFDGRYPSPMSQEGQQEIEQDRQLRS